MPARLSTHQSGPADRALPGAATGLHTAAAIHAGSAAAVCAPMHTNATICAPTAAASVCAAAATATTLCPGASVRCPVRRTAAAHAS